MLLFSFSFSYGKPLIQTPILLLYNCRMSLYEYNILSFLILFGWWMSLQNQRIRCLLEKCTSDHEARIEAMQFEKHEKALSEAKWREIRLDKTHFVSSLCSNICLLATTYVKSKTAFKSCKNGV